MSKHIETAFRRHSLDASRVCASCIVAKLQTFIQTVQYVSTASMLHVDVRRNAREGKTCLNFARGKEARLPAAVRARNSASTET